MNPGHGFCAELGAISSEWARDKENPFLAFAATHHCICQRVERRGSDTLNALNQEFSRRFIFVYHSWSLRQFRGLHVRWIWALTDFHRGKLAGTEALIEFAFVHIFVDLRHVLCLLAISPEEYSSVNADVNACIRAVALPYMLGRDPSRRVEEDLLVRLAENLKLLVEAVLHRTITQTTISGFRWWVYQLAERDKQNGCREARRYIQSR